MENKFLVVGYYTLNTPYEKVFNDYLWASVKDKGLLWNFRGVISEGSWKKNTGLKPHILYECLKELRDDKDRIVYLDADATIEKFPSLFNEIPQEYDLACHFLDWKEWYGYEDSVKELLTGTLYIRKSDRIMALMRDWEEESRSGEVWEQKILQKLLKTTYSDIKVYPLPLEYCYITSLPNGDKPRVQCDPVISHHQVSRTLRKLIK